MKRVVVLAVGLVLLVLIVGSVSAHIVQEPPTFPDKAASGKPSVENVIIRPPTIPSFAGKRAAVINHIITTPPDPMGVPTDQFSLNNIVNDPPRPEIAPKRVVAILSGDPIEKNDPPPGVAGRRAPTAPGPVGLTSGDPDDELPPPPGVAGKRAAVVNRVIIAPPPWPDSAPGDGVSPEQGKASPILFRHGSVIVEGTDGDEKPPSVPK